MRYRSPPTNLMPELELERVFGIKLGVEGTKWLGRQSLLE